MKYLLDTCVISELVKRAPHARVVSWLGACREESLYLSVLTLGEIQKGIARLSDAARKDTLQRWLDGELRERFSERLLSIDQEVALTWGQIHAEAELKGVSVSTIDGLLAATAIALNLTLVTRNESDFRHTSVRLLNPWTLPETE